MSVGHGGADSAETEETFGADSSDMLVRRDEHSKDPCSISDVDRVVPKYQTHALHSRRESVEVAAIMPV